MAKTQVLDWKLYQCISDADKLCSLFFYANRRRKGKNCIESHTILVCIYPMSCMTRMWKMKTNPFLASSLFRNQKTPSEWIVLPAISLKIWYCFRRDRYKVLFPSKLWIDSVKQWLSKHPIRFISDLLMRQAMWIIIVRVSGMVHISAFQFLEERLKEYNFIFVVLFLNIGVAIMMFI